MGVVDSKPGSGGVSSEFALTYAGGGIDLITRGCCVRSSASSVRRSGGMREGGCELPSGVMSMSNEGGMLYVVLLSVLSSGWFGWL